VKLNIGACPPATMMASKRAMLISDTGLVFSTSAARLGVLMKPMLMRSDAE